MRGRGGGRMGGRGRMGPRMAPLYRPRPMGTRRMWRRPMWGWYPIRGPYMWGVGCLLPVIGAAALFVLTLLRWVY